MKFTTKQTIDGRRRFKKVLPKAREMARDIVAQDDVVSQTSARFDAASAYIREDNMRSLVVYKTSRGWYADIILKSVPEEMGNRLGTPVESPLPSREEAEKQGIQTLASLLAHEMRNAGKVAESDVRVFTFHNMAVSIPGDAITYFGDLFGQDLSREGGIERAADFFMAMEQEHGVSPNMTEADLESLPDEAKRRIFAAAAFALSLGMDRYPDLEKAPMDDDIQEMYKPGYI